MPLFITICEISLWCPQNVSEVSAENKYLIDNLLYNFENVYFECLTLKLHVVSCCESVRSRVRSAVHSSLHVCFMLLHAVRVFIGCVRLVMSRVNTWLISFLISLRVRVLFCTWLVIYFAGHCFV